MHQQITSLATPPRATKAWQTARTPEQIDAERARDNRDQVITTYLALRRLNGSLI